MLRRNLLFVASLVPLFLATSGARADICFEYGTGGGVSVAKGVSLPAVNACRPVTLSNRTGVRVLLPARSATRSRGMAFRSSFCNTHTQHAPAQGVTSSRRPAASVFLIKATSPGNQIPIKSAVVMEYTPTHRQATPAR